jgi:hypothetical protein
VLEHPDRGGEGVICPHCGTTLDQGEDCPDCGRRQPDPHEKALVAARAEIGDLSPGWASDERFVRAAVLAYLRSLLDQKAAYVTERSANDPNTRPNRERLVIPFPDELGGRDG